MERERNQFLMYNIVFEMLHWKSERDPDTGHECFYIILFKQTFCRITRMVCACKRNEIYYNGVDTYKIAQFRKSVTGLTFRRTRLTRISVSHNENEILVCSVIRRAITSASPVLK